MKRETERERSRYGPRTLKKPGSPEWCWQTVERLVRDHREITERYRSVAQTLDELIAHEAWKIIPSEQPYGSLDAMLVAEIGTTNASLKQARKLGEFPIPYAAIEQIVRYLYKNERLVDATLPSHPNIPRPRPARRKAVQRLFSVPWVRRWLRGYGDSRQYYVCSNHTV
jgi:hypothetical protein